MTQEDEAFEQWKFDASLAAELDRLGPVCAGCGEHCGPEHFDIKPGEEYCLTCALSLVKLVS